MGFLKKDKGTLITIFFFNFQILGMKASMLTNFQVHLTILQKLWPFVYGDYFGQNDVILAKNDVIAPQGEISEV